MAEDDDLGYVVPEEGSLLWEDTMCIPRGGPNPENAHAFINFILDAEVHGAIAELRPLSLPERRGAGVHPRGGPQRIRRIYPPREVLERCEVAIYKGEEIESLYQMR